MRRLLNTLFVMTQGAYLHIENETVAVEVDREVKLRVPLHHLGGLTLFGNVLVSPFLLGKCAENGIGVAILSAHGRFLCRMEGAENGNILLRQAQFAAQSNAAASLEIARAIVAAKIKNSRTLLMRGARECENEADETALREACSAMERAMKTLKNAADIDAVRGLEGEAASLYFGAFDRMIKPAFRADFSLKRRNRRPPLDPTNALLSFLYTLASIDCASAASSVGLDAQLGFLHSPRSGRSSLALDLVEEFRAPLCDRLALALINRRQIGAEDFDYREGGAVWLSEKGRKIVAAAYQERRQDEVAHPLLKEKAPIGLLPHIQARLLARHLRGDCERYLPMIFE